MADRFTALTADIEWRANTGQAEVDVDKLRRQFHEATQDMSTQAIKASAAQDRLDRALLKHGPSSTQAKNAEASLRRELETSTVAAGRHSAALQRDERSIERLGRGALVGSGAIRGLARAAVFASSGFLGGFGLTYAIRSFVSEASTLQEETEKTGIVFGQNARDVQDWAKTLALSFGIGEGEALKFAGTFGNILRPLHFSEQAAAAMSKRLVELAADMASFNNASPVDVLQAIQGGLAGQVRPLRQYGVFLSQARLQEEALAAGIAKRGEKLSQQQKIQAAYNIILKDTKLQQGDVARNTESQSVAQSKLRAEYEDSAALIGRSLLPEITHLTNEGARYVARLNETGELQRDVNKVVRDGSQVVHGLADGFHAVRAALSPLIRLLGGTEQTAKLVVEAFAAYKLLKIATAVRSIGLAWGFVGTQAKIAAAAETVAAGAGAGAAGAGVAGAAGSKLGAGALAKGGATVGAALLFGKLVGGFSGAIRTFELGQGKGTQGEWLGGTLEITVFGNDVSYRDPITGQFVLAHGSKGEKVEAVITRDFKRRHPNLARREITGEDIGLRGASTRGPVPHAGGTGGKPAPHDFKLPQRYVVAEARAQAEGTEADQLAVYREELAYVRKQIASGKLTKKTLADAYNTENQLEDQIGGIVDARNRRRDEAERKRDAAAKKRAAHEKARIRREHDRYRNELAIDERKRTNALLKAQLTETLADDRKANRDLIDFYRKESHDKELTEKERQGYVAKMLRAEKAAKAKKTLGTVSDLYAEAADEFRRYGSNIAPRGGALSPQDARGGLAYAILQELREQTRHIKSTATSTEKIGKGGIDPITMARALAGQGL